MHQWSTCPAHQSAQSGLTRFWHSWWWDLHFAFTVSDQPWCFHKSWGCAKMAFCPDIMTVIMTMLFMKTLLFVLSHSYCWERCTCMPHQSDIHILWTACNCKRQQCNTVCAAQRVKQTLNTVTAAQSIPACSEYNCQACCLNLHNWSNRPWHSWWCNFTNTFIIVPENPWCTTNPEAVLRYHCLQCIVGDSGSTPCFQQTRSFQM